MPAWADISAGTALLARGLATTGVAEAGAGANLSAICAMKVPRPARIAAVIRMLRMTPRFEDTKDDFSTQGATPRLSRAGQARLFREKDERSVNAGLQVSEAFRFRAA